MLVQSAVAREKDKEEGRKKKAGEPKARGLGLDYAHNTLLSLRVMNEDIPQRTAAAPARSGLGCCRISDTALYCHLILYLPPALWLLLAPSPPCLAFFF